MGDAFMPMPTWSCQIGGAGGGGAGPEQSKVCLLPLLAPAQPAGALWAQEERQTPISHLQGTQRFMFFLFQARDTQFRQLPRGQGGTRSVTRAPPC